MPNLQTLPVELVLEILLYVFVNIRGRPDKQLEILSRVCKVILRWDQAIILINVYSHGHHTRNVFYSATCASFTQMLPMASSVPQTLVTNTNTNTVWVTQYGPWR